MKKEVGVILSFVVVVFMISFVSANLFDDVKNFFTGKISQQPQNVNVNVQGVSNPDVTSVENINLGVPVDPFEGGSRTLIFVVRVYDADGEANLGANAASAKFVGPLGTDTGFIACGTRTLVGDGFSADYTCTIDMQYYYEEARIPDPLWTVTVTATDLDGRVDATPHNTETFEYTLFKGFNLGTSTIPNPLTWPTLAPAATNRPSSSGKTELVNTGNYGKKPGENIFLTTYDLRAADGTLFSGPGTEFSVGSTTGVGDPECNVGVTAVAVTSGDGVDTNTGIGANAGPSGSNTASAYYCIPTVPSVPSQAYSTTNAPSQAWVIKY